MPRWLLPLLLTVRSKPLFDIGTWEEVSKCDPVARQLADRHYSRQKVGSREIGPPGRKLVLMTPCRRALWLTHWPFVAYCMDGLDAYRCSIFRNEGAGQSLELIVAAMEMTVAKWGPPPRDGWVTFVEASKVRSANPGYCFLCAGWRKDRSYTKNPKLIRLRHG